MPTQRNHILNFKFSDVVWKATHLVGNLSEWNGDTLGGVFDNGTATTTITTEQFHSNTHALKCSTPGNNEGSRIFRWADADGVEFAGRDLYYSAWLYIPNHYDVELFWNVFQFKMHDGVTSNTSWILNINSNLNDNWFYWWDDIAAVNPGGFTAHTLPIAQWCHVEVRHIPSASGAGRLTVWLDGIQIADHQNITTMRNATDQVHWGLGSYTDGTGVGNAGTSPTPSVLYWDNAKISRTRVGV